MTLPNPSPLSAERMAELRELLFVWQSADDVANGWQAARNLAVWVNKNRDYLLGSSPTLPDVAAAGEQALVIVERYRDDQRTLIPDNEVMELLDIIEQQAKALTSSHLSGIREGREEAAKVALKVGVDHATSWTGDAAVAASNATFYIEKAIRALPDPPAGETT